MDLMKLTKADIEEAKLTIWSELCDGSSDSEIMDMMGLEQDVYLQLKFQTLEDKAQELRRKPPEHVYVEYIINQTQNIQDLTEMIGQFKKTKQYNALVGAVRARADLYDKLVAKGQEFGVFAKAPERKIVAGVLVGDLSADDLRTAITKAIGNLDAMMSRYGDSNIIDVTPDSLHYGPSIPTRELTPEAESAVVAPPSKKSKTARAKTSRTSKAARGRRPFKER